MDFSSTYVDAINHVIDLDASRRAARIVHVPTEVFVVLVIYMVVTAGVLGYVLGDGVTMVSSAEESAKEVFTTLTDLGLVHERPRPVTRRFLTPGSPAMFEGVGRRLMGGFVEGVEQVAPATLRA